MPKYRLPESYTQGPDGLFRDEEKDNNLIVFRQATPAGEQIPFRRAYAGIHAVSTPQATKGPVEQVVLPGSVTIQDTRPDKGIVSWVATGIGDFDPEGSSPTITRVVRPGELVVARPLLEERVRAIGAAIAPAHIIMATDLYEAALANNQISVLGALGPDDWANAHTL